LPRAFGKILERLFDDAQALADFLNAYEVTIVDVAAVPDRNVELELVVIVIRKPLADVVRDAGRAQHGTRETPVDGFFRGNCGDAFRPHFENLVVTIHLLDVIEILRNRREQRARPRDEILRNIVRNSADPDVADGKASAAAGFDQVVDFFARAEAVPEVADRAH